MLKETMWETFWLILGISMLILFVYFGMLLEHALGHTLSKGQYILMLIGVFGISALTFKSMTTLWEDITGDDEETV